MFATTLVLWRANHSREQKLRALATTTLLLVEDQRAQTTAILEGMHAQTKAIQRDISKTMGLVASHLAPPPAGGGASPVPSPSPSAPSASSP